LINSIQKKFEGNCGITDIHKRIHLLERFQNKNREAIVPGQIMEKLIDKVEVPALFLGLAWLMLLREGSRL